ncbi:acetyltransferase [Paenibacillus sp. CAA11]|uniref:acyltransferase family protein n=1 Tax=Paenibacillus sp. CAA11 TaxID=1532905 RepID=UPI000D39753A|nr:acyltransferase family protein [Paenibacillus sp. CAA11]AWB44044.1 acetyltransferase [Paenibacillus sp. CAA11]
MPEPLHAKDRYMAGLDGLRALAVIAVVIYHLNSSWAPGGLLGVSVFFVLSGYLITDILLAKKEELGHFDLKDFWLRRARRLLPAMLSMLLVVIFWAALFGRDHLSAMRGDVPAALLYISNWWFIFHKVSYFDSFGPLSPLGHLWSLAVEEQFYLIWPLVLGIALYFGLKKGKLALWMLGAALISALAMALLYSPGTDPSRVYYGTDTRIFSLLCGAALAAVWPSRKLKPSVSQSARNILDLAGAATLVAAGYMVLKTNEYQPFLYRGGLLLLSIAAAVTVAAIAHPAGRLGQCLAWAPLRWIGVRSYGLYLWHYPVIVMTTPSVSTGPVSLIRVLLQVLASLILAALSWHYIEEPIRHGAMGRLWSRARVLVGKPGGIRKASAAGAAVLLVVFLAVFAVYHSPSANPSEQTATVTHEAAPPVNTQPAPGSEPTNVTEQSALGAAHSAEVAGHPAERGLVSGEGITAIGDSVMLDAKSELEKRLPGITVDGMVGRQMSEVAEVVEQLKTDDKLGEMVIIEVGTNGAFTSKQLQKLIDSMSGVKHIFLVNTRVPRPWQSVVNETLEKTAAGSERVTLLDWFSASEGKDEYFGKDGVHLGRSGSEAYAHLIAVAIHDQLKIK